MVLSGQREDEGDGLDGEVASGDQPLVVLFDQQGASEADQGRVAGEDLITSERRAISRLTRSSGWR